MDRLEILAEAARLTGGDRDKEYGTPYKNLSDCAALWGAYLNGRYGVGLYLTAEDVAQLNVLQKIARTHSGVVKQDTYVDEAAYAAIAGECANLQG